MEASASAPVEDAGVFRTFFGLFNAELRPAADRNLGNVLLRASSVMVALELTLDRLVVVGREEVLRIGLLNEPTRKWRRSRARSAPPPDALRVPQTVMRRSEPLSARQWTVT